MAKKILPLTVAQVRDAAPSDKMYRLADGNGLALWVYPTGLKSWRLAYTRPDGAKDTLTLGPLEKYTLGEARKWRDLNRAKIANGENPKEPKKSKDFKTIFEMWMERWRETVTPGYALQVERAINSNIMFFLKDKLINEIEPIDIVNALSPMEARGAHEYLRRTKQSIKLIFDFAISRGLTKYNPVTSVSNKAFMPHKAGHFAALSPDQLPKLIMAIERSEMENITRLCIYLQLLTFVRPAEAAGAKWAEIDFDNNIWTIPAERTKTRKAHTVHLTALTIKILLDAKKISNGREHVFLGRNFDNHINVETARVALRRLKEFGIDTTAHGLRSLASTSLNRSKLFRPDAIEAALAHTPENKVRAAYNREEYMDERAEMLEWWSQKISKLVSAEN